MRRWSGWEKAIFAAFLFWGAAGLVFTLGKISPATVSAWPVPGALQSFVAGCLRVGDPLLILLAFANTHLHAARQWSPTAARRWALIVLTVALVVETLGVRTGFPFGHYQYSDRFGPMLGVVPFTILLAWHVVVTNAVFLARRIAPAPGRTLSAVLTGLFCTAYDFVLEPFAAHSKHYWDWTDGRVPFQNYAAWFVISALLAAFAAPRAEKMRFPRDLRPAAILGVTLVIFLAGTWAVGR